MGPDEQKKLQQLLFMKRQLPEPAWNLFNRTSVRLSRFAERMPSIESQAAEGVREEQRVISQKQKEEAALKKQELQKQAAEQKEISKRLQEAQKGRAYNKRMEEKVIKKIKKKFGDTSEKTKEEIQEMRDKGWDKYRV